jgi:hypothetical protein
MDPKTSRDLPGAAPRHDDERDQQKAVIKDADKSDGRDREDIHGDGEEIGLEKD